ncbi:MAG: bacteriohemerythrin [Suilimivivens sp.]
MYRFTEDCLTGIGEIDEEHRRLFQLINETMEILKENGASKVIVKNLLKELREYAGTHFAHEEAYMEKIGDMELPRQKKEHAEFAAKVDSYQVGELTEEESTQMAQELLTFMAKWLYRHILGSDTMIGKLTGKEKAEDVFAFTDKYKTGITLIDDEHRRLFEIIKETNDVIQAELLHDKYDAIVHILEELKDYTIMHFQDEERYMESIGYQGLELQRVAHTAFVDRLNEMNLDDVDNNQKEYLEELIEFLLGWLSNHILKMDKQIPAK